MDEKIEAICRNFTSVELESKLVEAGVPCAQLSTVAELELNPQVKLRELIEEWDYPVRNSL